MERFATDVIRRAVLELEKYCTRGTIPKNAAQAFLDWVAKMQPVG